MNADNPFDKKLEIWGNQIPSTIREAAVNVTDTLDLAWAAAKAVFEEEAKPEHALKILEIFLSESDKAGSAYAELFRRHLQDADKD